MSAKTVVHYGNPILKKKCKPVKDFSQLDSLIDDMFDTMYEENGIGLAANQIDVDLQLFVVDISDIDEEGESIHVFVNAEIIATEGESWMNEGCLSVPDVRLDVMRSNKITLVDQSCMQHASLDQFSIRTKFLFQASVSQGHCRDDRLPVQVG